MVKYNMLVVDILKKLIKIDTRTSISNETSAALYLKKVCDSFNIENQIVEPIKGKGSFIAHIPGLDKKQKELLLLAHLDTDEFGEINKWKFDPLSGEEYNGVILGRGAIDCKGLVSIFTSIMINIRKNKIIPKRGIIFAAVADEEVGGKYGMEYLIENVDLIKNCEYVIGEGGGFPIKIGKNIYFTCQNGEKGSQSYEIDRTNALIHVEEGVTIYKRQFINLLKGVFINKIFNIKFLQFLILQYISKSKGRKLDAKELLCDCYHVCNTEERVLVAFNGIENSKLNGEALKWSENNKCDIKIKKEVLPSYTKVNTSLYKTIVNETSKISKRYKVIPVMTPGYSDNRYLRYKNKIVYGYFPLSLKDNITGIHGYNERISIGGLLESHDLLCKIVSSFINM